MAKKSTQETTQTYTHIMYSTQAWNALMKKVKGNTPAKPEDLKGFNRYATDGGKPVALLVHTKEQAIEGEKLLKSCREATEPRFAILTPKGVYPKPAEDGTIPVATHYAPKRVSNAKAVTIEVKQSLHDEAFALYKTATNRKSAKAKEAKKQAKAAAEAPKQAPKRSVVETVKAVVKHPVAKGIAKGLLFLGTVVVLKQI